jgi:hypothetical protein
MRNRPGGHQQSLMFWIVRSSPGLAPVKASWAEDGVPNKTEVRNGMEKRLHMGKLQSTLDEETACASG